MTCGLYGWHQRCQLIWVKSPGLALPKMVWIVSIRRRRGAVAAQHARQCSA